MSVLMPKNFLVRSSRNRQRDEDPTGLESIDYPYNLSLSKYHFDITLYTRFVFVPMLIYIIDIELNLGKV